MRPMGIATHQAADLRTTERIEPCFGLVMSGGGARGAYEAGVLSYILDELPGRLGRAPRFQIVTGTSVDMGNGLPKISFEKVQELAADPAATAAYYAPWISSIQGDGLLKDMQPLAAESE